MNPLTMAWRTYKMFRSPLLASESPEDADHKIILSVTRSIVFDGNDKPSLLRRFAAEWALMIRISREWTAAEIIDTSLDRSGFGRKARSLHAAADAYFGDSVEHLTQPEQLALMVVTRYPSTYEPACNRERFEKRYTELAIRTGIDPTSIDGALERLRPQACLH